MGSALLRSRVRRTGPNSDLTSVSAGQGWLVGATGLEPVPSSVSAKHREPLCYPPLSQVTLDRRCRRETLTWRPGKRSLGHSTLLLLHELLASGARESL